MRDGTNLVYGEFQSVAAVLGDAITMRTMRPTFAYRNGFVPTGLSSPVFIIYLGAPDMGHVRKMREVYPDAKAVAAIPDEAQDVYTELEHSGVTVIPLDGLRVSELLEQLG